MPQNWTIVKSPVDLGQRPRFFGANPAEDVKADEGNVVLSAEERSWTATSETLTAAEKKDAVINVARRRHR